MPPAVQSRTPASSGPAARKQVASAIPSVPKPDSSDFRQELVRQRKAKAEKSKPRESAEAAKSPAKSARAQKGRKGRAEKAAKGEANSGGPGSAGAAAQGATTDSAAAQASAPPTDLNAETQMVGEVAETRAAESSETTEGSAAAGASGRVRADAPRSSAPAGAVDDDDDHYSTEAVSALAATANGPGAVTGGQGGAVDEAGSDAHGTPVDESGATEDVSSIGEPHPPAVPQSGAKPQPAGSTFGQALGGSSRARSEEGEPAGQEGGGNGSGDPNASGAASMQDFEAAARAFADAMAEDDPDAAAPHAARAGTADASAGPAVDFSPRPASPGGIHSTPGLSAADATPPEARFAAANHENIVKGMHAEVMPNGGTMRIRLDPPQLGALQVTVHVRDGVVTAAFETSNDEATRLLGHSLNQLKAVLESHGVGVDKLQVQQAPRDEHASAPRDDGSRHQGQTPYEQEQAARQEQQRKEMLQKMWRRLSGMADPLDVTV